MGLKKHFNEDNASFSVNKHKQEYFNVIQHDLYSSQTCY